MLSCCSAKLQDVLVMSKCHVRILGVFKDTLWVGRPQPPVVLFIALELKKRKSLPYTGHTTQVLWLHFTGNQT